MLDRGERAFGGLLLRSKGRDSFLVKGFPVGVEEGVEAEVEAEEAG